MLRCFSSSSSSSSTLSLRCPEASEFDRKMFVFAHKISSTNQLHNLREIMLIWRLLMVMRYPQRTHPMEKTEMAITFWTWWQTIVTNINGTATTPAAAVAASNNCNGVCAWVNAVLREVSRWITFENRQKRYISQFPVYPKSTKNKTQASERNRMRIYLWKMCCVTIFISMSAWLSAWRP